MSATPSNRKTKMKLNPRLMIFSWGFLYQSEMLEGIIDAVVVNRGSHVVSLLFEGVECIPHGDANAGGENHRRVVASITKGQGMLWVKAFVGCHRENSLTFVSFDGCDIGESWMPTT